MRSIDNKNLKMRNTGNTLIIVTFALGAVISMLGFLLAFLWVAPANGAKLSVPQLVGGMMVTHQQLISQKIFFFHMPVAIISFVLLAFCAYYALRYIKTRMVEFDLKSSVVMEIVLIFVILTMITGDLWTKFEWGVWWVWDPRLTTYLILMFIAIAYFVLRKSVENPEQRAVFSAVLSVFAFIDVPICFLVTRIVPSSVHPVVIREGGMTPETAITATVVLFGMALIAFSLYQLRLREIQLNERLSVLKSRLEDGR